MLILYGLKTCDTCRKARRALEGAGREVAFVDLREDEGLASRLDVWLAAAPDALVNRASTTWRGLPDADKARAETDPCGLLAEHPALIKRPVIDDGGAVTVGWKPDVRARYGL